MMMALGGMPENHSNACVRIVYGSASRVSNAVTRSSSHESGATNQCYTIHTVSTVLHTHHRMSLQIYNIQIIRVEG